MATSPGAIAAITPAAEPPQTRRRRTYTGAALARRKAWGTEWGNVAKQISAQRKADKS